MTTRRFLKFVIGFVAGVCVIVVPKIFSAWMNGNSISLFGVLDVLDDVDKNMLKLIPLVIGTFIMFWKWDVSEKLIETFVTALGLPALFVGSLSTADVKGDLVLQKGLLEQVKGIMRETMNDCIRLAGGAGLAVPALQHRYVLELDRAPTRLRAEERAKSLETKIPGLQTDILKSGDNYLVVKRGVRQTKPEALLDAIKLSEKRLKSKIREPE